jgi:hypothetical protein
LYCDKEGIGGLIHRYGVPCVRTFAEAFDAVGATEIASALRALPQEGPIPESLLARTTTLITERRGYTYESLEVLMPQGARAPQPDEARPMNPYILATAWFFAGCLMLIGVAGFGERMFPTYVFVVIAISILLFIFPAIVFALFVFLYRWLRSGRRPLPRIANVYEGVGESFGYCPNCCTLIPTATALCPHCHAQFGDTANWHVLTAEQFAARIHEEPSDGARWFLLPIVWVLVDVIGIWVWLSVNSYLVTFCPPEKVRNSVATADQTCDWDLWVFFVRDMSCVSFVAFFTVTACAILAPTNKRSVAFKVAGINGVLGVFLISSHFKPWAMVGSHHVTVGVTFLVALFLTAMLVNRENIQ